VLDHLRAAIGTQPERAEALAQLHGSGAMTETETDEALQGASTLY
jgi:hypothetical protein